MSARTRGWLTALGIIAVFLLVRLLNFGHVLMWDEARFMATLRAMSSWDQASPFWVYTRFHPPLYLLTGLASYKTLPSAQASLFFCKTLSLLSSLGVMGLVYLIGRDLEGKRTGTLAALAYALMPAAAVLNVWVKEDSLCLLLSLLSIYLFLKKRPWWSGVSLGLALLTKEFAASTGLTLALFALLSADRERWKKLLLDLVKVYVTAVVFAGWWYLFVSNSVGYFRSFFMGDNAEALRFYQPWHYYLTGLWDDMGGVLALAALGGTACMLVRLKKRGGSGGGGGWNRESLRPLAWTLATFAPCFFSYGKPYWLISMALPALALTAAIGLEAGRKLVESRASRGTAAAALAILLAATLAVTLYVDNAGYINSKGRYVSGGVTDYSYSLKSREAADFFNGRLKDGHTVLGIFETLEQPNPIFFYYFDAPGNLITYEKEKELAWQIYDKKPAWTFIADNQRALLDEMFYVADYFDITPVRAGIGYAFPTGLLISGQGQ